MQILGRKSHIISFLKEQIHLKNNYIGKCIEAQFVIVQLIQSMLEIDKGI
jgi:hypothetical protein